MAVAFLQTCSGGNVEPISKIPTWEELGYSVPENSAT